MLGYSVGGDIYEPCQSLLVPTSPLYSYVSIQFIKGSVHTEALYRAAWADHCIMVTMVFLQWANPCDDFIKMSPVSHDPRLLQNVYKGVLLPFSNAVVRFAMVARVYNIVAKARRSPVLAHAANHRASEIDWSVPDCPVLYSYDCRRADMREGPPTHRGGGN